MLSSLLSITIGNACFAQSAAPKTENKDQIPPYYKWQPIIPPELRPHPKPVVDEPIVPQWVDKDVDAAKWIAKIMPVEKRSFSSLLSLLKVDEPSEDEWYGFGARRFYIGHGNGYTSFYVDAFTFKGKIGYYKVGIDSSSRKWPQIKQLVINAWKDSGGPEVTEDEDGGFFYSRTFEAVLNEYKSAVESYFGKMKPVSVPENLQPIYQYLISPMEKSIIGDGICGLPDFYSPGPWPRLKGREALDAIVDAKRIDLLENALIGYNPGGRVYAALELLRMQRRGERLNQSTRKNIRKVMALRVKLSTCSGCLIQGGLTGREIVEIHLSNDSER
jgi:hypothetical protein